MLAWIGRFSCTEYAGEKSRVNIYCILWCTSLFNQETLRLCGRSLSPFIFNSSPIPFSTPSTVKRFHFLLRRFFFLFSFLDWFKNLFFTTCMMCFQQTLPADVVVKSKMRLNFSVHWFNLRYLPTRGIALWVIMTAHADSSLLVFG